MIVNIKGKNIEINDELAKKYEEKMGIELDEIIVSSHLVAYFFEELENILLKDSDSLNIAEESFIINEMKAFGVY